ncbi:hypothetical protein ACQB6R_02825 [Propionibacteriaceae bacterium G1746]|uniref:hypothetical protein n=1 Tax=Aestuariimicrobium sp. G57 TaxID=3418485 RepID=UPI003C256EA8
MSAPAALPTVQVWFGNKEVEKDLMDAKAKIEEFQQKLLGYEPEVRTVCIALCLNPVTFNIGVACYAAYRGVLPLVNVLIQAYNDMCQWVWAPFNLTDMANALQGPYDHATLCKQSLVREAMPADQYWEGDAVDAYYGYIAEKQNPASADAESVVKSLKDGISNAGLGATIATFTALGALIAALIELIVGLIGLIPPATPAGAALIALGISFAGGVIAGLIGFAKAYTEVTTTMKNEVDGKLRSNAFPAGQWPKPTSKGTKSDIQDVGGWSYE